MIQLDYRTNNPRWGYVGVNFTDWNNFCLTLGFLSNINHYINRGIPTGSVWDSSVAIHVESNHMQGAWDSEGRIQYYKDLNDLQNYLIDLYTCSSAGVGNITCRINSNGYIQSLINDFNFQITNPGNNTADIIPPLPGVTRTIIQNFLLNYYQLNQVNNILNYYDIGFNM